MTAKIVLKPRIQLGVVPTHLRFVGGLVPDAEGKFPRNEAGVLETVAGSVDQMPEPGAPRSIVVAP